MSSRPARAASSFIALAAIAIALFPVSAKAEVSCACYFTVDQVPACLIVSLRDDQAAAPACRQLCRQSTGDSSGRSILQTSSNASTLVADCNKANGVKEPKATPEVTPYQPPPPRPYITPKLSVEIPGVSFSQIAQKGGVLEVPFLADYVTGVYKFLLTFAVLVAIIMLMIGGFQYVLFAGGGNIGAAKERIKNAIVGLILLFAVYILLYTVNPRLVTPYALEVKYIDPIQFVGESGDTSGGITKEGLAKIGVTCDGKQDVTTFIKSLQRKVTYRFGAKGNAPPYKAETKTCDGKPCKSSCPENTICLDCSGFVGLVAECTGLASKNESGGTNGIFSSAPKVESCGANSVYAQGANHDLTPGDLLGFKPGDFEKKKEFGHVWMYVGNGQVVSSSGGSGGRNAGGAMQTQTLKFICENYPLRFVDR